MEEALLHEVFGVPRTYHSTGTEFKNGALFVSLSPAAELFACPKCKSLDVIRKGKRTRRVQSLPIGFHPVFFQVEVPRCHCKACRATFEVAPPFCPAYAHYTQTLARYVYGLSRVMTMSDVADLTLLGWDTVKAIVAEGLEKDYSNPSLKKVRHLGIDEIHLGSKKRFYTIVIDLDDGRILWAKSGRGKAALQGFWRRLRLAKAKIKAVATDMSAAYWSAVVENLPQAALVFDKFHVVKLMNERLDNLRREMVREAEGPVLKKKIKGTRFLLLRNPESLSKEQIPKLDEALKFNQPLLIGWYLKEELRELWSHDTYEKMKAFMEEWCRKAAETCIPQIMKMAKTLKLHATGILNYAKHRITSGRMEGINNKIKTLNKKAYGYHDENFFILKLLSLRAHLKLFTPLLW